MCKEPRRYKKLVKDLRKVDEIYFNEKSKYEAFINLRKSLLIELMTDEQRELYNKLNNLITNYHLYTLEELIENLQYIFEFAFEDVNFDIEKSFKDIPLEEIEDLLRAYREAFLLEVEINIIGE